MNQDKINYIEFHNLPFDRQIQILETDGVVLAIKEFSSTLVELYAIYDFYAELKYNTIHGMLVGISTFDTREKLDAYLNNIDINDLYY